MAAADGSLRGRDESFRWSASRLKAPHKINYLKTPFSDILSCLLGKRHIFTKAELKSKIDVCTEKMCLFFIPNLDSRRYSRQHHRVPGFCSFCTRGRWGCTRGGCAVAVCTFGASWQKYRRGAQIWQLMFSSLFFFVVYSLEVVSSEPSVSVEARLLSILQIRDVTLFCFLLLSFLDGFPFAHVPSTLQCCLLSSIRPVFFTPMGPFFFPLFTWWLLYSLIPPPFAWGDPICLLSSFSFPFLPSPSLLSPPPLLPVSVHCPSTLSSNSITFSLLLFFQLLCFNLFLLLPPTRLEILILGIWHSFALSSASLFILLSPVYHFLPSIAVSRSLYYLLNWSPSLPIFNRNFALAWIIYV